VPIHGQRKRWIEYLYDLSIGLCLFLSGWTTYKGFHDVFGVNDVIIWNIPFALVYAVAVTVALVYIAYRIRDEAKPLRLVALYLFVDLISVFSFNYLFFHERLRDELSLEGERVVLAELATDQGLRAALLINASELESGTIQYQLESARGALDNLKDRRVSELIRVDSDTTDTIPARLVKNPKYDRWIRAIEEDERLLESLRMDSVKIQVNANQIGTGVSGRILNVKDSLSALQFERDRPRMRQLVLYLKNELRAIAEQDSSLRPTVDKLFKEPTPYVKAIADNYLDAFAWLAGRQEPIMKDLTDANGMVGSTSDSVAGESIGRWMAVLPALLLDLVPLFLSLAFRRTNMAHP